MAEMKAPLMMRLVACCQLACKHCVAHVAQRLRRHEEHDLSCRQQCCAPE